MTPVQTFPPSTLQRLRLLYLLCLAVLTVSSIGIFVMRSMEMSGVSFSEVGTVLSAIILKTHYGSMWLLRLTSLFCAWAIWWAGKRHMTSRFPGYSLLFAAVVIAFSRSSSGHLADFGDFSVQQCETRLQVETGQRTVPGFQFDTLDFGLASIGADRVGRDRRRPTCRYRSSPERHSSR